MESNAIKQPVKVQPFTATRNACKLCSPLGAALVFKGIENAVPLLHGSQGCSTYIRRYVISHFREPVDIACTNFSEQTAIFGGGANLKLALENIRLQYDPALIGVATTCLSETIGDDVPMMLHQLRKLTPDEPSCPVVHVSTASYRGTHMDGFHGAVKAIVEALAQKPNLTASWINLFPGMLSPADLRHLRELVTAFGLRPIVLPDYSDPLDGAQWTEYNRIPPGGTPVAEIEKSGAAQATIELGQILAGEKESAGQTLASHFAVPLHALATPIGIAATDALLNVLHTISGEPTPDPIQAERGRLIDSYVDGHKYVMGKRAVLYGEEDLVAAMAGFLSEIGIIPVLCASGGRSGRLAACVHDHFPEDVIDQIRVVDGADFADIDSMARNLKPDLIIGSSKGYRMARALNVPLVRIGFPIHDRFGGARLLHVGYRGTQQLFDRVVNAVIEKSQNDSDVGYGYI